MFLGTFWEIFDQKNAFFGSVITLNQLKSTQNKTKLERNEAMTFVA